MCKVNLDIKIDRYTSVHIYGKAVRTVLSKRQEVELSI